MKIVIVDDNHEIRESLTYFLSNTGNYVEVAKNGLEAFELAEIFLPDVIISDIRMPVIDGNELLKKIKNDDKLKNITVILITAFGDIKDAVEAMKSGAYDYLLKPINIKELNVILKRIEKYKKLKIENRSLKQNFNAKIAEVSEEIVNVWKNNSTRENSKIGIFSQAMKEIIELAKKFHDNENIPILINGETGTGKEVIARYIHCSKGKSNKPFIALNCAAIPVTLLENELFGYESGAYTGGNPKGQKGKFELAFGGTLFLDEIGELSNAYQAKLLRVIEEKEFYKVGGIKKIEIKCRIICATNINIAQSIKEKKFRADLYYRFSAGFIRIPPLRDRKEEIIPLVKLFLNQFYQKKLSATKKIPENCEEFLVKYPWPGNVRELKNVLERWILISKNGIITKKQLRTLLLCPLNHNEKKEVSDFKIDIANMKIPNYSFRLDDIVLNIVKEVYIDHKYKKNETANFLGISRFVLYNYLKKIKEREEVPK